MQIQARRRGDLQAVLERSQQEASALAAQLQEARGTASFAQSEAEQAQNRSALMKKAWESSLAVRYHI